MEEDWKLKIKQGLLKTPYSHFTLIADGEARNVENDLCPDGKAMMSLKCWAIDADSAVEMIIGIGGQLGFTTSGRVQIYETEVESPPGEAPYGYDANFVPYNED